MRKRQAVSDMRRAPIVLVLVLAVALLASCGKGSDTTSTSAKAAAQRSGSAGDRAGSAIPPTHARALAFAHAVNLTPADVPGFTATAKHDSNSAGERHLEREMLRCAGIAGTAKGVAEESSENFQLKHAILDLSVSSEVSVQPSAAQASRSLDAIRSAHVRGCFSHFLAQIFKGQRVKGATAGPVTIQSGTPPAAGTSGSFGWRVTANFDVRGIKVPIYLDFLGFVQGPTEVTLLSSGLIRPFPASIQQRLFSLLLSRAKAHSL
jgi:hypothetical protein